MRQSISSMLHMTSVLLCAALAASCQTDDEGVRVNDGGRIRFELTSSAGVPGRTRSSVPDETIPVAGGLTLTRSDAPSSAPAPSRAVLIDSVSQAEFGTFGLYGFMADGTKVIDNETVTVSGTTGTLENEYRWKKNTVMSFVGYYPQDSASLFSAASATGSWTFRHTVPAAATSQRDLMLSHFSGTSATGTAVLAFSHPLASVRFIVGAVDDEAERQRIGDITAIRLSGVHASGTCTVTPSEGGLTYAWEPEGTATVTSAGDAVALGASASRLTDSGHTFALLPQDLTQDKVTLELATRTAEGVERTFSVELNTGSWQAGHTVTYTVTPQMKASVTVDDEVEDLVKKDVVITNSGSEPAYVRAAITGWWYDSSWDEVVAPWDHRDTDNMPRFVGLPGTSPSGTPSWVYSEADGYYYYTGAVAPGESLCDASGNALFTSYTIENDDFPEGADQLGITITVQLITKGDATDYMEAWE